jgi:hypothetical protein
LTERQEFAEGVVPASWEFLFASATYGLRDLSREWQLLSSLLGN